MCVLNKLHATEFVENIKLNFCQSCFSIKSHFLVEFAKKLRSLNDYFGNFSLLVLFFVFVFSHHPWNSKSIWYISSLEHFNLKYFNEILEIVFCIPNLRYFTLDFFIGFIDFHRTHKEIHRNNHTKLDNTDIDENSKIDKLFSRPKSVAKSSGDFIIGRTPCGKSFSSQIKIFSLKFY